MHKKLFPFVFKLLKIKLQFSLVLVFHEAGYLHCFSIYFPPVGFFFQQFPPPRIFAPLPFKNSPRIEDPRYQKKTFVQD